VDIKTETEKTECRGIEKLVTMESQKWQTWSRARARLVGAAYKEKQVSAA